MLIKSGNIYINPEKIKILEFDVLILSSIVKHIILLYIG